MNKVVEFEILILIIEKALYTLLGIDSSTLSVINFSHAK